MVDRAFSRATAGNAKRFLAAMVEAMPFPIASAQVDGGSKFMADFEQACEALRSPSTSCRSADPSGTAASNAPADRPRTALDCRTPNEYLVQIEEAA